MNATMKAVSITGYGGPEVLQTADFPKPTPKSNEILVRNYAASVTAADTQMRTGKPWVARLFVGLRRPKAPIPGTGFAGIVEAVGSEVKSVVPGDRICGESLFDFSAYAEYVVVKEEGVHMKMPELMNYHEGAVLCDGGVTSMNFIKNVGEMKAGERLLVIGASGALGTAAIQIAKSCGIHVTGLCSGANAELVLSLGADEVIDYKVNDFTKGKAKFDVIYDTVGKSSFRASENNLTTNGRYICPVMGRTLFADMLFRKKRDGKKCKFAATGTLKPAALTELLGELMELYNQRSLKMVMDRSYAMDEASQAHSYIDSGRKRGNVVLALDM